MQLTSPLPLVRFAGPPEGSDEHDWFAADQDKRDQYTAKAGSRSRNTVRTCSLRRCRLVVFVGLAALSLLLMDPSAHAATAQAPAVAGSVDQVLTNMRNWLLGILAGLATVFLTVGGVRYVMGGGDPGEIEKAKTAFKTAGIGYGLAVLAPLVVTVLQGIVG